MVVMTLTEFNQNRSKALRYADTEDVLIQRDGVPAYRLSRISPPARTIAAEFAAGRMTAAESNLPVEIDALPIISLDVDMLETALRERENQRWPSY